MKYHAQLLEILRASKWSQEVLAQKLGVSFATLNSWVNERSVPRKKAIAAVDKLYVQIVGSISVDDAELSSAKKAATKLRITPKTLIRDKPLLDKLTLHLTYHTNTIEGSTMTISDVEEVIFDHKILANRTAIEQAEARNHQAALTWLVDELAHNQHFVIDKDLMVNIHIRLMNGIISDAGKFRNHSVRIMGSHVPLANWQKIPELVDLLSSGLQQKDNDIISVLATTHAKFEQIHPFSDGNGRTGRLLMLAQALNNGLVPPLVLKERKYAYYKYLELAQTQDKLEPLELFIAESMQSTHALLSD
ncbi:hypothetical protein BH23PAT2_BH23PAT2_08570 [soil metagenome]